MAKRSPETELLLRLVDRFDNPLGGGKAPKPEIPFMQENLSRRDFLRLWDRWTDKQRRVYMKEKGIEATMEDLGLAKPEAPRFNTGAPKAAAHFGAGKVDDERGV